MNIENLSALSGGPEDDSDGIPTDQVIDPVASVHNSSANDIASEGAKQLIEAAGLLLNASYADQSESRSAETAQAKALEAEAYNKLATVSPEQAKALVEAELAKINDGQLRTGVEYSLSKFLSTEPDKIATPIAEESELSRLMRFASGQADESTVKIDAPKESLSSTFSPVEAAAHLDELLAVMQDAPLPETLPGQAVIQNTPTPQLSAAAEQKVMAGRPVMHAPATLGELAGQAIASAIATPFLALSSAGRHLMDAVRSPAPITPDPRASLLASRGVIPPAARVLSPISDYKCERIESLRDEVIKASNELRATPEFLVFQEKLAEKANELSLKNTEILYNLSDARFNELKERMDFISESYSDIVARYRTASNAFEKHLRAVIDQFPNSSESIRERVEHSLNRVMEAVQSIPGFGERAGEYTRPLTDRLQEVWVAFTEALKRFFNVNQNTSRSPDLVV